MINDDEAVSGSPDASLPLSDQDDLDAYNTTDHQVSDEFEDDDENENNLSDSINLEELQALHSSSQQYDNFGLELVTTSSYSDAANLTKIAYVKGNIRTQKEKPQKSGAVNITNNTIDGQRWMKAGRRSRQNHQARDNNYEAITCELKCQHVWHAGK